MNIDWTSIGTDTWKVLVTGLLFGAGLPFLFSVGIRLWDQGSGGEQADGTVATRNVAALTIASVLFAIVAAAVVTGVLYVTKASIAHYLGIQLF